MMHRFKNVSVALWEYLNQPVLCIEAQDSVWKPSRFWYLYKIRFLEACWYKDVGVHTGNSFGHDEFKAEN